MRPTTSPSEHPGSGTRSINRLLNSQVFCEIFYPTLVWSVPQDSVEFCCEEGYTDSKTNGSRENMNYEKIRPLRPYFLIAAIIGFLTINGPFLYYALIDTDTYAAAMKNGMALLFIGEAFFLMIFLAIVIAKIGWKSPGWIFFVAMSILGSLAFSIPLQLYLVTRTKQSEQGAADKAAKTLV
jgi:hypothetical protein